MSKVYDFSTGLSFESLSKKFDGFHDWVIQEFKVFAAGDDMLNTEETEIHYDAEVILRDPYKRFSNTRVSLHFENVNSTSVRGLSELGSELSGIDFEHTPTGIHLTSSDGEYLKVEAEKLTLSFPS